MMVSARDGGILHSYISMGKEGKNKWGLKNRLKKRWKMRQKILI